MRPKRIIIVGGGFVGLNAAKKLGGKEKTLFGLSGIGDIILSCSSKESRNMNYGFALGSKSRNTSDLTEGKFSVKLIPLNIEGQLSVGDSVYIN